MEQDFIDSLGLDEATAQLVRSEHQKVIDAYESRIRALTVDAAVKQAVAAAGGRNLTAIRALMDESTLEGDIEAGAKAAVAAVRRENPYLFAGLQVTAPGTGTPAAMGYTQEELGKLPLSEYRRYRKGL